MKYRTMEIIKVASTGALRAARDTILGAKNLVSRAMDKPLKPRLLVFEVTDACWRGIGTIPDSGLKLGQSYQRFDAEHAFKITPRPAKEAAGCRCGDILRGYLHPMSALFLPRPVPLSIR